MSKKHATCFSGIGAPEIAATWMGWVNVFHCEKNPFCQQVLSYYFPNSKEYTDVKTTDFTIYRGLIDVLTSGFPCQPYSVAGKQKGTEDDRHLWPENLRAIREIQPRWVVGENVLGIVNWNDGLVFEQVQADLESEGYEVQTFILPAAGVGAPHRRYRVWFIAFNPSFGPNGGHNSGTGTRNGMGMVRDELAQAGWIEGTDYLKSSSVNAGHAKHDGLHSAEVGRNEQEPSFSSGTNSQREFTGTDRLQPSEPANSNIVHENVSGYGTSAGQQQDPDKVFGDYVTNSFSQGSEGRTGSERRISGTPEDGTAWGRPTRENTTGNWNEFPTQSPVCDGNDGISDRLDAAAVFKGTKRRKNTSVYTRWYNESIMAGGNAMVPQVVYQIYKAIDLYESKLET